MFELGTYFSKAIKIVCHSTHALKSLNGIIVYTLTAMVI